MDTKLVLIKAITLVYYEICDGKEPEYSNYLIEELISTVPDQKSIITGEPCAISSLKETLSELLRLDPGSSITKADLIQRVIVNVGEDSYLIDALEKGIVDNCTKEDLRFRIKNIRGELSTIRSRSQVTDIIKKASSQCAFNPDGIDWKTFVPNLVNQLESNHDAGRPIADPSMIGRLDLTDKYAIKEFLNGGKEAICGKGIMRTGWQGLNKMCDGGIRRGELVVVGALKHNFKSGMLLNIPRQIIQHNTPYMYDDTKKPLILHITLENELETNIITLHNSLWEKKYKEKSTLEAITSEEDMLKASEFIMEEMSVNGYTFHMLRLDPSVLTYEGLFKIVKDYEADNFEIHMLSIDYLPMMQLTGCTGSLQADQIRDLYRRCRNFCVPRHIALLTAHQLSPAAVEENRANPKDFVKRVVGKSYYDRCKAVDHEADLEITINIEKPGDSHSYLTMARGKHRKPTMTPEKELYQVYRFEEIETIPDDVDGPSNARRTVGGGTVSEGGGDPWYGRNYA